MSGIRIGLLAVLMLLAFNVHPALAQLGALVSPGRLSQAHASLEGVANCLSCHAAGQQVATAKCLSCHKPIAERITQKRGVHRAVTTDCVSCHVEHAGVNGELRPFDQRRFDHRAETGFALDGLHAPLAANCAACHKTRSFLAVAPTCASCHTDPHKGTLGANCASCHATSVRFANATSRFDHTRTAFPLTGAHTAVLCASCHPNRSYTRSTPATCATCHDDPHERQFGQTCSTCHTTTSWMTRRVDHARTTFPLRGSHATIACVACHTRPAATTPLRHDTCAACHADPHRGTFTQDCSSCHTESTFAKGAFDHSTTRFALADGHAGLACASCHRNSIPVAAVAGRPARTSPARTLEFRGLSLACASCHEDPHRTELGATCESCHSTKTFEVAAFRHARHRTFFEGAHTALRCEQCHMSTATFTRTATECASCHRDVHLGQVGTRCENCHAIDRPMFAVVGFSHGRTAFPLTGRHAPLECALCHKSETAPFPAGPGTAIRLAGFGGSCVSCHSDPHGAQLGTTCEQCHTTETFRVRGYAHQNARALASFFTGPHGTARCEACHKPASSAASASRSTADVNYRLSTTCTSCHEDRHRGALGPRCESCHRLN